MSNLEYNSERFSVLPLAYQNGISHISKTETMPTIQAFRGESRILENIKLRQEKGYTSIPKSQKEPAWSAPRAGCWGCRRW